MVNKNPDPSTTNAKFATRLAYVITGAWAISFLLDAVIKTYEPPLTVHALMMLVAGAVFGEGLIKSRIGGNQSTKKETEDE